MSPGKHSVRSVRPDRQRLTVLVTGVVAALVAALTPALSSASASSAVPPAAPAAPGSIPRPAPTVAAAAVPPGKAGTALVRTPDGGYWVFALQRNGHIFQMVKGSGNWFAPHDLGGPFVSAPAASYAASGNRIDLYAVSPDGKLKTSIFSRGRWSPWVVIARGFAGGVSAIRMETGELRVFGVGSNGQVRQVTRINGRWRTTSDLGSNAVATSAVYYAPSGYLDLFAVGKDGRVRHRQRIGSTWTGWQAATVEKGFVGASAIRVAGVMKIYVVHRDGRLFEFGRGNGRWGPLRKLGSGVIGTPAAKAAPSEFRVVVNRSDGVLVESTWRGGWSAWRGLPAGRQFPQKAAPVAGRVELAKKLLERWGGRLTGLPGVKADLQATAAGRGIRNADSCGRSVYLDATMLRSIVAATDRYHVLVNNMVTGHGCDSGQHPKGKAVDFNTVVDPRTGRRTNWHSGSSSDNIGLDVEFLTHVASVVKGGGGAGQRYCAGRSGAKLPAGMVWFDDYCNHQHIDVR